MRGASMATAMDEDYEKEEIQRILNSYRTLSKTKVFGGSSNKKKLKRQDARELKPFDEDEIFLAVSSDKIDMGSNMQSNSLSGPHPHATNFNQKVHKNNNQGNEIATIHEENYTTFSKFAEIPSIKIF